MDQVNLNRNSFKKSRNSEKLKIVKFIKNGRERDCCFSVFRRVSIYRIVKTDENGQQFQLRLTSLLHLKLKKVVLIRVAFSSGSKKRVFELLPVLQTLAKMKILKQQKQKVSLVWT